MRISLFAAVAFVLLATPASAQNVGGRYQVQGSNFNGSPYGGTAQITLTSPTTCRIVWTTGSTVSQGICMRQGNMFSAAYRMNNAVGLAIYEVRPNGTLEGSWTIADQAGAGRETLVPQP